MSTIKTHANANDAEAFINTVTDETKRQDSLALLRMFEDATKEPPVMWGAGIIGFGKYHYKSQKSRQEGDWPLVAFSPRKQSLTLYVLMPEADYSELLSKLGKHTTSASCLYIKRLADVDLDVLTQLIARSYADAQKFYT